MRSTGIFEAKKQFSQLIAAVEAGEEVRITRHGREIVRMIAVKAPATAAHDEAEQALRALKRLRARVKPGPGWRELRDEGRKV